MTKENRNKQRGKKWEGKRNNRVKKESERINWEKLAKWKSKRKRKGAKENREKERGEKLARQRNNKTE